MKVNRFELTWMGERQEGYTRVKRRDGKWNLINSKDEIVSPVWYKYVWDVSEGLAPIQNDEGKENFIIVENGNLLSQRWFESVERFSHGMGKVFIGGQARFINCAGKVLD